MKILRRTIFLLPFVFFAAPLHAQQTTAVVVPACGTPPTTYVAGQSKQLTQDTTGTLCTPSGGGGGGGGAVTAVAGAYAAGSIVDLGTGASPAANTVNARLATLNITLGTPLQAGGSVVVTGTLPAGTNLLGKVGIDQTTPGTTNGVVATGNVASGASDSGNPIKIGGIATSSAPSAVSTTQRVNAWYDLIGQNSVFLARTTDGTLVGFSFGNADTIGTGNLGLTVTPYNLAYDGASWDRERTLTATDDGAGLGVLGTGIVPTSAASQGLTTVSVAGASTNVLKSTAGNVYSVNAVGSTTAGFVVIYDATAAPSSGTTLTTALIRWCFQDAASNSLDKVFSPPLVMTNGAVELFSTSCTTYTAPAVAPIFMTGQVK